MQCPTVASRLQIEAAANALAAIEPMAKILDVPTSGSIADRTHSHNRSGQYIRNRRTPTQPVGTGRRAAQRANFGGAASAWASLTFSEQAAWIAYADSHPYTDRLGQSIKITGFNMYVAINSQLLNCGEAQSDVPPIDAAVFDVGAATVTVTALGVVTVTPSGNGSADDFLIVSFSKPQSSGVTFCKTFWQQSVNAGGSATPLVVSSGYVAQFGLPPAGSRVFFKLTPVNQYGVTGVPLIGFATVT